MAREMKWTAMQVAEHFMNRFYADRKTLLMREPAKFTRATEHIEQMKTLDKSLMPDRILSDLTPQEAADLLEYVRSPGGGK